MHTKYKSFLNTHKNVWKYISYVLVKTKNHQIERVYVSTLRTTSVFEYSYFILFYLNELQDKELISKIKITLP